MKETTVLDCRHPLFQYFMIQIDTYIIKVYIVQVQAGAELGNAQLKLDAKLGLTLFGICCIKQQMILATLMATNNCSSH